MFSVLCKDDLRDELVENYGWLWENTSRMTKAELIEAVVAARSFFPDGYPSNLLSKAAGAADARNLARYIEWSGGDVSVLADVVPPWARGVYLDGFLRAARKFR